MASPSGDIIILSIPLGPKEDLSSLDIAKPAFRFCFMASMPFTLFFFYCSFTMMYGLPNSSNASDIYSLEYSC